MNIEVRSAYLKALRNRINLQRAPFSARGSRLVIMEADDGRGLLIKLAERLTSIEPGLGTHLARAPFIDGLRPVDGQGTPLDYEIETYPHALFLRTRIGVFGLTFHGEQTLCIGLPEADAGLRFHVRPTLQHQTRYGGDFRAVSDFAYTATTPLLTQRVTPSDSGYDVECIAKAGVDSTLTLEIAAGSHITERSISFTTALASAEDRWHEWFEAAPNIDERWREQYLYAWWVMGNNLVAPRGVIQYEAMMPSKSHYIGIWQWDAFFHALAYRHVDATLAENQFRVMFACQQQGGMLPDAIWDEGIVTEIDHPIAGTVTKPPIAAWAAWKVYQTTGNLDFVREVYEPLVRLNNWWLGMNDDDADGLAQYNHPFSSGLDDNPLWDYGMPVESPELNTYLCLGAQSLAEMARVLGRTQEEGAWQAQAATLVQRMIEVMYDAEAGIFWANRNGERVPVVTPFNLYPLLTGMLPKDIADRLVEHIRNPDKFWSRYPLPTVAMDDLHYDPHTMWRGPVWININALFIDGLRRAGYLELAEALRMRTLELVASQPGINEYYHPQTGEPPAKTAFGFGWSAACFIDLLIDRE